MRLQPIRVSACATLLAIVLATELHAQTTTSGGLTGVITDQSNAVMPNADVKIKDNDKGITQSNENGSQGVYRFFFLSPGQRASLQRQQPRSSSTLQ
jgi:hypothetical protein